MNDFLDWPGISGTKYRYYFTDITRPYLVVAANYVFVKQLPNGNYVPLYFGETGDASTRITEEHEQWGPAKRLGATGVMTHSTQGGVLVRCAEEKDLIERWQPALNVQHRKAT